MPRQRRSELAAGIFVIIALAVALGVVLWLGGSAVFRPARQVAHFFVEEKEGPIELKVGNAVQINSGTIGRISAIRYLPDKRRTIYEAEIQQPGAVIYSDAEAIVTSGLVGEARLTITNRGTEGKPPADEQNPVHLAAGLAEAMNQMASAARRVNELLNTEFDKDKPQALIAKIHGFADLLTGIAANLKPETNPADPKSVIFQVRQSVDDIQQTTGSLRQETDPKNPDSILAKVRATVSDASQITADAKPKIDRMLTAAADTAERMDQFAKKDIADILGALRQANSKILAIATDFEAVAKTTRQIVVLNRDNVDTIIENMTQVSATLKATAEEIRANPWLLTRRPQKDEVDLYNMMTAATAFSRGASALDRAVAKLKNLNPDLVRPDDPQVQSIRDQLRESFRSFKEVEDALWKEMERRLHPERKQ